MKRRATSSSSESEEADKSSGSGIRPCKKTKEQLMRQLDEDSLSQDDSSSSSHPKYHNSNVNQTESRRRQESSVEEDEDRSIDVIEERIRKLEEDLEERISKHKQDRPKKVGSGRPKQGDKGYNLTNATKQLDPIIESKKKQKPIQNDIQPKRNKLAAEQVLSPKQKRAKEVKGSKEAWMPIKVVTEKQRAESSRGLRQQNKYLRQAEQLSRAQKQIQQQQTVIEQLRTQNRRLREQLTNNHKKGKSYAVEQALVSNSQAKGKLSKQIELLKIIEGLQIKLKKSISRKLAKQKGVKTSATLLHKGLPSTLLS